MRRTVTMPVLSDTMQVGRLSKWLKQPGDRVQRGDAIAEVETDKAVLDVEAFHDGYLAGPLAPLDTDLPVGTPIAYIADSREEAAQPPEQAPPARAEQPETPAKPEARAARPAPAPTVPEGPPTKPELPAARRPVPAAGAVPASPYARALARDLGVDLTRGGGNGPLRAADVLRLAHSSVTPDLGEGPPHRIERRSPLRDAIARNMTASAGTPAFRVTALLPLERLRSAARDAGLSLTLLLARACALVIEAVPLLNAVHTQSGIARRERVDVGIAMDVPDGLITPVLRDVGRRELADLARDWDALREKVKTRRLAPQDYKGATFYLSDLGVFPVVESFDSLIPVGASAILSVGAVRAGTARCTLSCDHRVVYGADAARFLTALSEVLADPEKRLLGRAASAATTPEHDGKGEELMSPHDYPQRYDELVSLLTKMGKQMPGPVGSFARLHKGAVADGALSAKVKELMALAISVATRCEECVAYHVHDALKAGATRDEVLEALGVAIMMGGGPAEMYACDAFAALDQFEGRDWSASKTTPSTS